jgi:hypothetical protein
MKTKNEKAKTYKALLSAIDQTRKAWASACAELFGANEENKAVAQARESNTKHAMEQAQKAYRQFMATPNS